MRWKHFEYLCPEFVCEGACAGLRSDSCFFLILLLETWELAELCLCKWPQKLKISTDELLMHDCLWFSFECVRLLLREIQIYELINNCSVSLKKSNNHQLQRTYCLRDSGGVPPCRQPLNLVAECHPALNPWQGGSPYGWPDQSH